MWSMRTWSGPGIRGFAINAAMSSCLVGSAFGGMGPWAKLVPVPVPVPVPWAKLPPDPVAGFAGVPCEDPRLQGPGLWRVCSPVGGLPPGQSLECT